MAYPARDVANGVFSHAIDDGIIEVNSVLGVVGRLQVSRDKENEVEPLTKKDVQHSLATGLT